VTRPNSFELGPLALPPLGPVAACAASLLPWIVDWCGRVVGAFQPTQCEALWRWRVDPSRQAHLLRSVGDSGAPSAILVIQSYESPACLTVAAAARTPCPYYQARVWLGVTPHFPSAISPSTGPPQRLLDDGGHRRNPRSAFLGAIRLGAWAAVFSSHQCMLPATEHEREIGRGVT
jgi:hypothetical protein